PRSLCLYQLQGAGEFPVHLAAPSPRAAEATAQPDPGRASRPLPCTDASAGERQRFLCACSKCLCSRRTAYNRPCFVCPALKIQCCNERS
uniref:Uncharacterized protein n=1 Tax=Corvus moneduloides TaxID=1196302 RepID=A0A8C3DNV2_CORMO